LSRDGSATQTQNRRGLLMMCRHGAEGQSIADRPLQDRPAVLFFKEIIAGQGSECGGGGDARQAETLGLPLRTPRSALEVDVEAGASRRAPGLRSALGASPRGRSSSGGGALGVSIPIPVHRDLDAAHALRFQTSQARRQVKGHFLFLPGMLSPYSEVTMGFSSSRGSRRRALIVRTQAFQRSVASSLSGGQTASALSYQNMASRSSS
jgi:hypothetical protein